MIPTAVLRHRVDIEPFAGTNGHGDSTYGPKRTRVRGWLNAKRTAVRLADGTDVIASATLMLRPDVPEVPALSRITKGTATYVVLEATPVEDGTGPHSQLLILDAEQ